MKKILFSMMILGALAGCSSERNHTDLSEWINQQNKVSKGKIQPLPDAKTYTKVNFDAKENPFEMKKPLSLEEMMKNKFAPDLTRQKEALEEFSLDNVKMVGSIKQNGKLFALIKDRGNIIHYATVGNHMGLNFGEVVSVSESEIILEERIKDGDEWTISPAKIELSEANNSNKRK